MSESYPTQSTYVAPFTVTDRDGDLLNLTGADIEFVIAQTRGGDDRLFEATDSDSVIEIEPDGNTGVVEVTIPATDITWTGTVWEELRIRQPNASVAVSLRDVRFEPRTTDA